MQSRRTTLTLAILTLPLFAIASLAADKQVFTQKAFAEAQQAGKSILVDIRASWCSTCKTQAHIIDKIFVDPKYKNIVIFDVDFDSQKDVVRLLRAQTQSTLIGYKGAQETGRSIGDTDPLAIEDLIEKTL